MSYLNNTQTLKAIDATYVIQSVGGNATTTTQAVYDEIKTLLAT